MIIHGLSQLSLQGAVNVNGQYIQNQTGSLNQVSTYIEYGTTKYEYPHIVTFRAVASEALNPNTPVYVDGAAGELPTVAMATAVSGGNASNGIILASASIGDVVDVAVAGAIMRTDTTAFSNGQTLYLAPSGGLTTSQISGSGDVDQTVAIVLVGGSATSGSFAIIPAGGGGGTGKGFPFTGSAGISGSFRLDGYSSSLAGTSSFEVTGSSLFSGSVIINNSTVLSGSLKVTGSTTIQGPTIISGSTTITGSLLTSGSLTVSGSTLLFGGVEIANLAASSTGSWRFKNTGSTLALEYYDTLNGVWVADTLFFGNPISGSTPAAFSASYALTSSTAVTASYALTASTAVTSSYAGTASYFSGSISNAVTSSYAETASIATSSSYALTASYATRALSASYSTTASYALTASTAVSSSYALTASYADLALTASYVDITGSGVEITYNGSQIQITSSVNPNLYADEVHVSSGSGANTNNGGLLKPVQTITRAIALANANSNIIVHNGTYNETATLSTSNVNLIGAENDKGTFSVITTLNVAATTGTTLVRGIQVTNLNIVGNTDVYLDAVTVTGAFTKTGNGTLVAYDCDLGLANGTNFVGEGTVTLNGGTYNDMLVSNNNTSVFLNDSDSTLDVLVTSGSFIVNDSIIYGTTSGSPALVALTGSRVELYNSKVYINNTYTPERINVSGSLGYADLIFNKVNSNLGNGNDQVTTYFQNIAGVSGGGNATVTVSGSSPSGSIASGSLWWNEEDGNLYIQANTPTGSTWVPAVASVAGGEFGATYRENYNGSTWTVRHNLGTTTPIIQVYSGSSVMIPESIDSTDVNTTTIVFSGSVSGSAIASTGVGGPTSASYVIGGAVPNWTLAGTIGTVGLGGTTTAPTINASAQENAYYYRQIGPKTWEVKINLQQTGSFGSAGSGDYLVTLPNGLRFDTTIIDQKPWLGSIETSAYNHLFHIMPNSSGAATNDSTCHNLYVMPWSNTQFRILTYGIAGAGSIRPWGSGFYQPTGAVGLRLQFTFQSTT